MSNEKTRQWLKVQNEQVTLPEFEIPNPIYGLDCGKLLKEVRLADRKECHMAQNVKQTTDNGQQTHNKPEKKFRAGGITATVWKNTIKDGDRTFDVRSVNLERSYKDKEGNWQNTNSMRAADLPRAILMLQEAFKFCVEGHESED
jgi:hypothetical protein